jgi:hypothetical protein
MRGTNSNGHNCLEQQSSRFRRDARPGRRATRTLASPISFAVEALEDRRLLSGIAFSGGFADTTGITLNGGLVQVDSSNQSLLLSTRVVDWGPGLASVWSATPQNVTQFKTTFTTQGFYYYPSHLAFVVQSNSNSTLGLPDGYLGYEGIPNSIAISLDDGATGLYEDGATQSVGDETFAMPEKGLRDQVLEVTLSYDGTNLLETVVDTDTGATFDHSYTVDIPAITGDSAYVGFTSVASDGIGEILSWRYAGADAPSLPHAATQLAATATSDNVTTLTWSDNADNESGYLVYRKAAYGGDTFKLIASVGANVTSFVDADTHVGRRRVYRVVAHNASGLSQPTELTTPAPAIGGAPIARYLFNEGSGTTVQDANVVGPHTNGLLVGDPAPQWTGGRDGEPSGLQFVRRDEQNFFEIGLGSVHLANDLQPLLGGTATLTAWIKPTRFGIAPGDPEFNPGITGAMDPYGFMNPSESSNWGFLDYAGRIGIAAGNGSYALSHDPIGSGEWVLVAFTRDADSGELQVYVNGQLSGSATGRRGILQQSFREIGAVLNFEDQNEDDNGNPITYSFFNYLNAALRDVRIYDRVLPAPEMADLYAENDSLATGISLTVDSGSIARQLQSAVNTLEGTGTSVSADFVATTNDQVSAFLAAVVQLQASTAGSPVNIVLDAQSNSFDGQTVSVPAGVILTINGAEFRGHSPSLTLTSGSLVITNSTLTNSTNAPTILVQNGSLTLRHDKIQESDQFSQAAIEIDGGSVDLGSASDLGNNTLDLRGGGMLLRSGASGPAIAIDPTAGNTLQIDGRTASAHDIVQGMVWTDFNNNGGVDFGEKGISGVPITLTGQNLLGQQISVAATTDLDGLYSFSSLWPGTYSIREGSVPGGYIAGKDAIGTLGGSNPSHSLFNNVPIGVDQNGLDYNFGQQPAPGSGQTKGQSAGIGFWANKNGQKLIGNFSNIGPWLAATLPATFGAGSPNNLHGSSTTDVANFFLAQFVLKDKLNAQIMSTALNVYATNASLGGSAAATYGFSVGTYGLGNSTWNIGADGAAFGVANNTTLTVLQILQAWDQNTSKTNTSMRKLAIDVFGGINDRGGV